MKEPPGDPGCVVWIIDPYGVPDAGQGLQLGVRQVRNELARDVGAAHQILVPQRK